MRRSCSYTQHSACYPAFAILSCTLLSGFAALSCLRSCATPFMVRTAAAGHSEKTGPRALSERASAPPEYGSSGIPLRPDLRFCTRRYAGPAQQPGEQPYKPTARAPLRSPPSKKGSSQTSLGTAFFPVDMIAICRRPFAAAVAVAAT